MLQPLFLEVLLNCDYSAVCGGCSLIETDYKSQLHSKTELFKESFSNKGISLPKDIRIEGFEEGGTRDRVDLAYRNIDGQISLGLFDRDRQKVLDLESCPQMSEPLEAWYLDFRKDLPTIKIASIRLRVSPSGSRGVWLDLPNETTRDLLQDGKWLNALDEKADVIEIGQRRKRLIKKEGKWKLGEKKSEYWFETYVGEELEPFPVKLNVGSFSQPGFKTNYKMIEVIKDFLRGEDLLRGAELCAGSGNLSFAISSFGISMTSTELDKVAVANANDTLKETGIKNLKFERLNAHRPSEDLQNLIVDSDLLVVDPPRSGLRASIDVLESLDIEDLPKAILYISCFITSLAEDVLGLSKLGYRVEKACLLDQFSHSDHAEYILYLSK